MTRNKAEIFNSTDRFSDLQLNNRLKKHDITELYKYDRMEKRQMLTKCTAEKILARLIASVCKKFEVVPDMINNRFYLYNKREKECFYFSRENRETIFEAALERRNELRNDWIDVFKKQYE